MIEIIVVVLVAIIAGVTGLLLAIGGYIAHKHWWKEAEHFD